MKQQLSISVVILIAIIVLALGFFGGMQYQKSQRGGGRLGNGQFGMIQGGGRFGGSNNGNRPVLGQITSMDSNSVTLKLPDGSSKIVILSSSTAINKQATGSKSDLKKEENIMVIGTTNSDGSITAQNIQLNPMMRKSGKGMMSGENATPSGQ